VKEVLAKFGGGLAIALSVLLAFAVVAGANLGIAWTVVLCGAAGALATQLRFTPALVLLVVGAAPAVFGGVAFLYLPSLLLIAAAAFVPARRVAHIPN
jgi:hypothetical protein